MAGKQPRPASFALGVHAAYACEHSNACCRAGWHIPIDTPLFRSIGEAVAARSLLPGEATTSTGIERFVETRTPPEGYAGVLRHAEDGACVFLDSGTRLCALQRHGGEAWLPSACRHFPRVILIDDRGAHVTLSHFCPTAARLLFSSAPLRIVTNPPAFPWRDDYEGLDARDALPPLVRPGLLADLDGFSRWEEAAINALSIERPAETALHGITAATERVRRWRPRDGPLSSFVDTAFGGIDDVPPDPWVAWPAIEWLDDLVNQSTPPAFPRPPAREVARAHEAYVADAWPAWAGVMRRYVASRLFASWLAYQGQGLRTIVAGAWAAVAVVHVEAARVCAVSRQPLDRTQLLEAIRAADLRLVHRADSSALAARLTMVESWDEARWRATWRMPATLRVAQ